MVQLARSLAIEHHIVSRAVFDRSARIEIFGLAQNLHARKCGGDFGKEKQRGIADSRKQRFGQRPDWGFDWKYVRHCHRYLIPVLARRMRGSHLTHVKREAGPSIVASPQSL